MLGSRPPNPPSGSPLGRVRAFERLKPFPRVPEWEEIMQAMRVMAERVVQGKQDIDSAVTGFDADVDDMLAKRRWLLARHASPGAHGT